jgi:hypothetical protein
MAALKDYPMKSSAALFVAGAKLFILPLSAYCQAPIHTTPCDLASNPQEYAGQLVEVRGKISIGFEDFTLVESGCSEEGRPIWLVYGGDEPTPTMSTVNDQAREPGSELKVNGRRIPLNRDAALDLFRQRLDAVRLSTIGDQPCNDCHLYRVTATLTGVFFAVPKDQLGGYGHLGCCHLLAIQHVSDVDAERTAIPMGGSFQCTSENRTLDADQASRLKAFDKSCAGLTFSQCQDLRLKQIAAAANYWHDSIRPEDGNLDVGEIAGNTSKESWKSTDRLKTYTVSIQSSDPTKMENKAIGGLITQETCHATVPPLPMSAPVGCRNLWSEFPSRKEDNETISRQVATGEETWRMGPAARASKQALIEAAKAWHIALSNDLLPVDCEKPMVVEGDQFTWCHWTARDGMQSLSIQVSRFGYLRHGGSWTSVPWFLTRGNGAVCSIGP